jgi:hypothetical protein
MNLFIFMFMKRKTPKHPSKQLALALVLLSVPVLFLSCATAPVALDAVGPPSSAFHAIRGYGRLVVYSETEARRLDKGIPYYPHSGYLITTPEGKKFKSVINHAGDMDEAPQPVLLPSGNYQIVARSASFGRVHVPVLIEAGQTTEVHLEGKGSWKPQMLPRDQTALVRLPDDEIVGWRALAMKR